MGLTIYDTFFQLAPNYIVLEPDEETVIFTTSFIKSGVVGLHYVNIHTTHEIDNATTISCSLYAKKSTDQDYINISSYNIIKQNQSIQSETHIQSTSITNISPGVVLLKLVMQSNKRALITNLVAQASVTVEE